MPLPVPTPRRLLLRLFASSAALGLLGRVAAGQSLTREGLERAARELSGLDLEPPEVEGLLRRARAMRETLPGLERLVRPETEPLTTVDLEEGE